MNKQALLNVAKALRESPNPEEFTMARHVTPCGSPACAFGHYAARTDLQDAFRLKVLSPGQRFWASDGVETTSYSLTVSCDSKVVQDHFEVESIDLEDLFGMLGCGEARTPIQAAAYIEQWVKARE